ncbi:MAG: S41 family peptidase [[Eubacterium] siraeum]|nr:S41 family peptidase [[Eubacterium] siraeum]
MKKKFSIGVIISVVAIACAITYVITITVSTNMFNKLIGGVTQREEIYSKIQEVDSYVRSASYYSIDEQALINSIINGYVKGLSDSEAQYLSESQVLKAKQAESGTIVSAGIEAQKEESGYIVVTNVYANSHAAELGVRVGDVITEIDGNNVLTLGADLAITALEGDENTNVKLNIQRSGEAIPLTVTRKSFTIQSVTSAMISTYGYIRIDTFNDLTGQQFKTELQSLNSQGALGYIIDVRSSSGCFDSLAEMLGEFISEQLIANAQYKDGTVAKFIETTGTASFTAPLVVVVNEGTVGPAELFAVSLRDFASAKIVGKQTAGKGTVTETKNLSDGTAIVLTTAEVLPAVTETLKGGIKTDFTVDLAANEIDTDPDNGFDSDAQLTKAFEVIETMKNS